MHRYLSRALASVGVAALLLAPLYARRDQPTSRVSGVPSEVVAQIRREALEHSEVMVIASHLTDVTGARLTNSPDMRRAQAYARDLLQSWGVESHLERWGPFGRGWAMRTVDVSLTAPSFAPLTAFPKAWSPGTDGPITGQPVLLDVQSASELDRYRGQLRGRIVLLTTARPLGPPVVPARLTDTFLLNLADAGPLPPGSGAFHPTPAQAAQAALEEAKWRLLTSESPSVVIESSTAGPGAVYATAATVVPDQAMGRERHPWDSDRPLVLPQLVMAPEHYNRLVRLLQLGVPVNVRINVSAQFYDDDPLSDNVVGNIPGSDLRDQIVMFGGQFDSWHTATGATDNASGAAAALEAMRILRALDLHPRRSIRIGLWSGEEQGELGSRAYVAAHLGRRVIAADGQARLETGPEYERFSAYFNMDGGAGRIRGVYLQDNDAVRPVFQAWLAPFADLGASTLTIRSAGFTVMSFDRIGLPAFQFIRDFAEGMRTQGHTNIDAFDALSPDDLMQSAAVMAVFAYQAAMRDDRLPRRPGSR